MHVSALPSGTSQVLELGELSGIRGTGRHPDALRRDRQRLVERFPDTMDIFEGTEQIQQHVISRAISGLRIE